MQLCRLSWWVFKQHDNQAVQKGEDEEGWTTTRQPWEKNSEFCSPSIKYKPLCWVEVEPEEVKKNWYLETKKRVSEPIGDYFSNPNDLNSV